MDKFERNVYVCIFLISNLLNPSNAYKNVRLQDYLCADKFFIALQKPFRGDPKLTLMEERYSAAIITQTWNTTLPGVYSSNKLKYDCNFQIKTKEHPPRGIYTIITKLKFRTDPEKNGTCLDYIQFSSGNRSPSAKICSDISINGRDGRLIFDQRDREFNVHIHISKRMISYPLELHMVLTAHSECIYPNDFQCDPNNPYSCISRYFERDNITNCMSPCRDELSCFHDPIAPDVYNSTRIALSGLASLFFTMVGVIVCVWFCWKYWNCIAVQQHVQEDTRRDVPVEFPDFNGFEQPVIEGIGHSVNFERQNSQTPQTSQRPKDLPPSYESLFPDR